MLNVKVKEGHEAFLGTKVGDIIDDYKKVAQGDFIVYKIVKEGKNPKHVKAIYFNHIYTKGVPQKTKLTATLEWEHISIAEGFHAYKDKPILREDDPHVVCEFVIPKGSVYFEDSHDCEIVSNEIVYIG